VKRRDIVKALEEAGYKLLREGAEHTVYSKPGKPMEQVPRHREVNENTAREILRRARRP
jgi:mRNA interferase HicA